MKAMYTMLNFNEVEEQNFFFRGFTAKLLGLIHRSARDNLWGLPEFKGEIIVGA